MSSTFSSGRRESWQVYMWHQYNTLLNKEGGIGVCGIAVVSHFSYGFTAFSIQNCGIAVSSSIRYAVFLAFEHWCSVKILILYGIVVREVSLQCQEEMEFFSSFSAVFGI